MAHGTLDMLDRKFQHGADLELDCEQSLFSSDLVRAVHARGRGKDARRAKRGHARGHLRVSRVLLDRLRKKRGCSQSTRNKATGISMWEDSLYSFTGHILQVKAGQGYRTLFY